MLREYFCWFHSWHVVKQQGRHRYVECLKCGKHGILDMRRDSITYKPNTAWLTYRSGVSKWIKK